MTTKSHINKLASMTLSGSQGVTQAIFGPKLWIGPIIASLILGGVGWYTHRAIDEAMHKQMSDRLSTTLNTEVEAVTIWLKEQQVDVELVVAAGPVHSLSRELCALAEASDEALHQAPQQKALRDYLTPQLRRYGYTDYFLVSNSVRTLASNQPHAIGKVDDGYKGSFYKQVLAGKSLISKPFPSVLELPDEKNVTKKGLPTIIVATPISDSKNGLVIGVLGLRIPISEFATILRLAQSGKTGDTFAFDSKGLLLSEGRFDDDMKRIGLLSTAEEDSILTVELRDPQVNLVAGETPTLPRAQQPLTRMAADAVKGGSGIDVNGYRDARGVPVIGAWKWLPEFDIGIATEMSVEEAYAPLRIVRRSFLILFLLSAFAAILVVVAMFVMARQQHRVEKAERMAEQLGQYTLEKKIGAGGMGSVYRAKHAYLRRPTAVKMLKMEHVTEEAQVRFEREVQLTSQLNHPNTIAIYDYGRTADGAFYYAMEFLDGINLEDVVKQFGPLPEGRVVSILKQICASIGEAHRIGIIHRDIKPANVLLTHRAGIPDFVKVLDFGLVKSLDSAGAGNLTAVNVAVGTPQYMSPEAIERPDSVTPQADIYSIGALAYFLVTGTPVFTGKTIMEICMKQVKTAPEAPSARLGRTIDPRLEALILRCLAKAPADRFPSTDALIGELDQCDTGLGWSNSDSVLFWMEFEQRRKASSEAVATTSPDATVAMTN